MLTSFLAQWAFAIGGNERAIGLQERVTSGNIEDIV